MLGHADLKTTQIHTRVAIRQLKAKVGKADAAVADTKAELGRVDALQALHIASAGFGEALDSLLEAASDALIETGHVGQSRTGPFDPN